MFLLPKDVTMPLFTSPNKKPSSDKPSPPLDAPPPLLPENLDLPEMPESTDVEDLQMPEIPSISSQQPKMPTVGEIPAVDLNEHEEPAFPLPPEPTKNLLEHESINKEKSATEKNIFDGSLDSGPLFPEIPSNETINFEEKIEVPITPPPSQEVTSLFTTQKQPVIQQETIEKPLLPEKNPLTDHFFISVAQYRESVVANNELKHVLDTTHDTLFRLMQLHNDKDLLLQIWQQSLEAAHHKMLAADDLLFKVR